MSQKEIKKMRGSNKMNQKYDAHSGLNYYEINNDRQPLVLIHAQGVDGTSYANVSKRLSKKFHIYSIDCYGHGKSSHAPESYNIVDISNAVISFIENVVKSNVWLLGHSSGGLIAAFIASKTTLCDKLILEDPPFFSSQGDNRKNTFNYIDLSTICHNYIMQDEQKDFVLYYFTNQYAWNLFPEKSRNKVRAKLVKIATTYRKKHPDKDLKVLFWPKSALEGFKGMNNYDPLFGETFYNDSFHCGTPHEDILSKISCDTIFMKAKTNIGNNGLLLATLSDDDVRHVAEVIPKCKIVHFDCGHGIHIEKPKELIRCLINLK